MTDAGTSPGCESPFAPLRASLGAERLTLEPPPQYPLGIVNITNHCNLACEHCFVFRDGNPNDPGDEMPPGQVLAEVERLRDRHGLRRMVWMGGEPMLRWRMLRDGVKLFEENTIPTNGTVPLVDFAERVTYVISLDGQLPADEDRPSPLPTPRPTGTAVCRYGGIYADVGRKVHSCASKKTHAIWP